MGPFFAEFAPFFNLGAQHGWHSRLRSVPRVESIATDPRHIATSPFTSYNYHGKGCYATMVDAVVLGATEVDVNFNAKRGDTLGRCSVAWDRRLAELSTVTLHDPGNPSFRDRIPVVVDEVTTLVGPSDLIDVVVTERGIAANPRREDLLERCRGSSLPLRDIRDIQREVEDLLGVAVIKWVDGTVLDTVWKITV